MLNIQKVSKFFGSKQILRDVDLVLETGQIGAILGPSGAGKSTLLAIIAGLERVSSGQVLWNGRAWDDGSSFVPAERRAVGFVFQDFALFPHLTVAENIVFGLRLRRVGVARRRERLTELLELLRLHGLAQRYPHQLSGGQKQRVAVARALAVEPRMLLFDESLSSLDAKLREELRQELKGVIRTVGVTALFVTHDPSEAMMLADRLFVLRDGRVLAQGPALELYHRPATREVAETLGPAEFWPLEVLGPGERGLTACVVADDLRLQLPLASAPQPGRYCLVVRPETFRIVEQPGADAVEAQVQQALFVGGRYQVALHLAAGVALSAYHNSLPPAQVRVAADPQRLHVIDG